MSVQFGNASKYMQFGAGAGRTARLHEEHKTTSKLIKYNDIIREHQTMNRIKKVRPSQ